MTTPSLTLTNVTARYGRLTVLDQLNLTISAGCHGIVGPNGAGKSTLLAVVSGVRAPWSGRITWDGRTITRAGPARRSRLGIGRTFQASRFWPELTVLDNVVLGAWWHTSGSRWSLRSRRANAAAIHLLDQVGLGSRSSTLAGALGYGQRRLLDLAIALAGQPRLLLLDEPTAGLADEDLVRLVALLRSLKSGTTVVLVEHHLDVVAAVADTITVLGCGRLLATGALPDVAIHPAVISHYPMLAGGTG